DATGASNIVLVLRGLCTPIERCVVYKLGLSDAIHAAQGEKDYHEVPTGLYCAHRAI
ncbi:hypothetical protein HAX54_024571, partial [Datura stramonium]|nr:hypothetical protein [Datura stramonium]